MDEADFSYQGDPDFYDTKKPDKEMEGRLYLTVPNQRAIQELLSVWEKYSTGKPLPAGYKEWSGLFDHLKDIRPWSAKDRLTPEAITYISTLLGSEARKINLELELLFYGDEKKDSSLVERLFQSLGSKSVEVLDSARIAEIRYNAVLVSISEADAKKLLSFESDLLNLEEIIHVRPQAMSLSSPDFEQGEEVAEAPRLEELLPPVAALFDGVVVKNHQLLKGRLVVDDGEGLESLSPVNTRHHGTAMASLILHGDLSLKESPLKRKLYVQYLLAGTESSPIESTPPARLLLDVIYSAVARLKEAPPDRGGDVFVVNLSLGDVNRPFTGQMSAWGRLIDFLAWKYNILFIVSTGNISDPLSLEDITKPAQISSMDENERRVAFIRAVEKKLAHRSLFSPAESINSLTVGASHSDGCVAPLSPYLVNPVSHSLFPSLISGLGLGYKQSVKPEILHSGGRALYSYSMSKDGLIFHPGSAGRYFGQQVAGISSDLDLIRIIGTSNAAALTTRAAVTIYDELHSQLSVADFLKIKSYLPSMVKAMLVHSASWGEAGEVLEEVLQPRHPRLWKNRRSNITRFLGYGTLQLDRVLACTDRRVTMIGVGSLQKEEAELFSFPIPASLSGRKDVRRLTVTLAWLSPTRPGEIFYKDALLDFKAEDEEGYPIGVQRIPAHQPPSDTSRRGTVIHEIFEGQDAVPIGADDVLRLRVECRTQGARALPSIPYAVVITFEVADTLRANVYAEIKEKLVLSNVVKAKLRG